MLLVVQRTKLLLFVVVMNVETTHSLLPNNDIRIKMKSFFTCIAMAGFLYILLINNTNCVLIDDGAGVLIVGQ